MLFFGTSLAVQLLRLRASTAGGTCSIPGQGTKIPRDTQYSQKKKKVPFLFLRQIFKIFVYLFILAAQVLVAARGIFLAA